MSPVADPRFTSQSRAAYVEDVTKQEWMTPLIMTGVGFAIIALAFVFDFGLGGAAVGLVAVGMLLALRVILGIIALWLMCVIMSTGVGPLGLACVRLVGIFTLTTATGLLLSNLGCMGIIINAFIVGGLLMWMFDLDGTEATVTIILMMAVYIVAGIVLASVFASM